MTTLTYSGTLVVTTCWCGIRYAMPTELESMARQNGTTTIYCPLGHGGVYKSENAALRKQLEDARTSLTYAREDAHFQRERAATLERSRAAVAGHLTRTKRRIAHGVCPCCRRTFQNVYEHMHRQHPEYEGEALPDA